MNEAPSHDNTFGPIAMGDEIWTLFNHDGAGLASKSGCPENYQPTLSELQKLYSNYPGGQIGERFGWPIDRSNFSWWVSDRVGKNYQTINLTSGYVNATKTASDNQAPGEPARFHCDDDAISPAIDANRQAAAGYLAFGWRFFPTAVTVFISLSTQPSFSRVVSRSPGLACLVFFSTAPSIVVVTL